LLASVLWWANTSPAAIQQLAPFVKGVSGEPAEPPHLPYEHNQADTLSTSLLGRVLPGGSVVHAPRLEAPCREYPNPVLPRLNNLNIVMDTSEHGITRIFEWGMRYVMKLAITHKEVDLLNNNLRACGMSAQIRPAVEGHKSHNPDQEWHGALAAPHRERGLPSRAEADGTCLLDRAPPRTRAEKSAVPQEAGTGLGGPQQAHSAAHDGWYSSNGSARPG
jgi:hypothetical protein